MDQAVPVDFGVVCYGPRVDPAHVAAIRTAVEHVGATSSETSTATGDGYTIERLLFTGTGLGVEELRRHLGKALAHLPADGQAGLPVTGTAVIPGTLLQPGPKLLILDVDSTLIKQEVIELLAAHAGREAEVAAVTDAAMRGELDFEQSLLRRVAALKGLPASVIDDVGESLELSDGAEVLVNAFLSAGHAVAAVSGGFSQVLEPLAHRLGLSFSRANRLGVRAGLLTGTVEGPVVDRSAKEYWLRAWAAERGVPMGQTIAVGDGANDLDMLAAAGLGVAFNAKPAVRAAAACAIDVPQLDIVRHFIRL